MTNPLYTHVAIVKRELNAGVTSRDDLIRAVLAHHAACGHYWWTAMDAAKWVDFALAKIKLEEQNGKS